MLDKINESALAKLHPELARRVRAILALAKADGHTLQIVQGLRTFAEQDALFAKGRTKSGSIVTNARGGQSWHNYGLAVDFAPVINGKVTWDEKLFDWSLIGKYAKAVGLAWGGSWLRFKDRPHVEMSFGISIKEALKLYQSKGISAVWAKVKVPTATVAVMKTEGIAPPSVAETKQKEETPKVETASVGSQSVSYEEMAVAMSRKPEWFLNARAAVGASVGGFFTLSLGLKIALGFFVIVALYFVWKNRERIKGVVMKFLQ